MLALHYPTGKHRFKFPYSHTNRLRFYYMNDRTPTNFPSSHYFLFQTLLTLSKSQLRNFFIDITESLIKLLENIHNQVTVHV